MDGDNGARRHVYHVKAEWDKDAQVWYVSQSDVPGLAAEADTPAALLSLLKELVPELIALNGDGHDPDVQYSVTLDHFTAERARA